MRILFFNKNNHGNHGKSRRPPHRAAGRCASHTEFYGERQVYSTAPTSPEGQKPEPRQTRAPLSGPVSRARHCFPTERKRQNLETLLTLSLLLLLLSPHPLLPLSHTEYSSFCTIYFPLGPHPNPGRPHALRRRLAASDRIGGARASRVDGGGLF